MIAKESVKSRLDRDDVGLSFTEFSYMLLQAYDFLRLYLDQGCTLQLGGSDQWGNITVGAELVRKSAGGSADALTSPLLLRGDGTKFGKSASGEQIWLDPARTSPFKMYQFLLNSDDIVTPMLLRYFSFLITTRFANSMNSFRWRPRSVALSARSRAKWSRWFTATGQPRRLSGRARRSLVSRSLNSTKRRSSKSSPTLRHRPGPERNSCRGSTRSTLLVTHGPGEVQGGSASLSRPGWGLPQQRATRRRREGHRRRRAARAVPGGSTRPASTAPRHRVVIRAHRDSSRRRTSAECLWHAVNVHRDENVDEREHLRRQQQNAPRRRAALGARRCEHRARASTIFTRSVGCCSMSQKRRTRRCRRPTTWSTRCSPRPTGTWGRAPTSATSPGTTPPRERKALTILSKGVGQLAEASARIRSDLTP
jgi:hypothetical protein